MSIKVCPANIKCKLSDLVASTNCTIPKKIQTEGGWGHTFFGKPSGICRFDTLPLEIPYKTKLHPWKFHKIVLYHLTWAIPEKIQTGEELRIYFFEPPPPTLRPSRPGTFHCFTLPLEIPGKTKFNPWIFHKIV